MMNLTQKCIILVGNPTVLHEALKTIRGFKAVTCVRSLNDEIVMNVYKHNKNIVHATSSFDISLNKYSPIIINVVSGKSRFDLMQLGLNNIMEEFPNLMDSLNIDVGDHKIHDSEGLRQNTCDCMVCRIVNGNPIRPEHILYETENFFVIPGVGAFFDGYVMVCPKRHIMSFAECTDDEFEEFLQVLNDIRFILKAIYKKEVFVFECGSGRNGGGKHSTSIVHAHIHFAVTDMPVLQCVQKSGIHPGLICPADLHKYGEYPYMLYIDQEDNWYIASDPDSYYPRQHPRQVLADYMGLKKGMYNWRKHKFLEKMDVIANDFYNFYRNNKDILPSWMIPSFIHLIKKKE